jgi:hypothetical protein
VTLEEMGIPTVSLLTEQFRGLGAATAKGKKMADLPVVVLPHLYDQKSPEAVREDIRERLPALLGALLEGQRAPAAERVADAAPLADA